MFEGFFQKIGCKLKKEEEAKGVSQWGIPCMSHDPEGRRKYEILNDNFCGNLGCSDGKKTKIMNLKVCSVELQHF